MTDFFDIFSGAEDQRDTPDARESHYRIDDSAHDRILTAEEPRDHVELKQSDATPVERADDRKD